MAIEELVNVSSVDVSHVFDSELLDEGVALGSELKDDSHNSEALFVGPWKGVPHNDGVHEVKFEVVLDTVDLVLSGAVEVDVISVVQEGTLSIDIGHFNSSDFVGRDLEWKIFF